MSIEKALADTAAALQQNTEAVNRLIQVSENLMKLRSEAIESTQAKAAPKTNKAPAKAAETKPNITETPEDRKDPAQDAPTVQDVVDAVKAFMGLDDDEARVADRKRLAGAVIKKYGNGAKRSAEIEPENRATFIAAMKKQHAKWVKDNPVEEDSSEDDDDLI